MATTTTNNTSARPARTRLLTAVREWLKQGQVEGEITSEEAIDIGRRYYQEHGWRADEIVNAQESAYTVNGVTEQTFMVCANLRGGDPQVQIRRSDGKVIGVEGLHPERYDRSKDNPLNQNWLPPYPK